MKIEHIGITVEDPIKAAEWYREHLGFTIVRQMDGPAHACFLADSQGCTVLEIYRNPAVDPPDYRKMSPLLLHLALETDRVEEERARLIKAGATPVGDIGKTEEGDELAMLRDPWGVPIQLACRAQLLVQKQREQAGE